MQFNEPIAYFLTFTTYGTWLHGDDRQSSDRDHNAYNTPGVTPDPALVERRRKSLKHAPTLLDGPMRAAVDAAIREVCEHRVRNLKALNVRTNHVHVVVSAAAASEVVLRDFKAYATRRIREEGAAPASQRIWTDGGSQRRLYTEERVSSAIRYVVEGQGGDLPFE